MENVIITENLTKKFGDFIAVDNVSFEVKKGEIFGFLGANGAGKTTAMKMLIGIWKPSSGNAKVAGFDIYTETEKIKKNIGYMSQKFSLYEDIPVIENIRFFGGIYGLSKNEVKEKSRSLLAELDMLAEEKTLVKALPLGWKQKLAFSIAIIHDPKIVFLDEPTVGVDVQSRSLITEHLHLMNKQGCTIVYTSHLMEEAENLCAEIAIIDKGQIITQGEPKALINAHQTKNLEELFLKLTGKKLRDDE